MPFLLLAGMGLSVFFAILALIVVGGMLLMIPYARTFTIDGQPATRQEFIASSWPLFVVFPVMAGSILAIAYSLWRELPWSRPAIVSFWIVGLLGSLITLFVTRAATEDMFSSVFIFGLALVVVWWYMFRKRSVAAYYRTVRERYVRRSDNASE